MPRSSSSRHHRQHNRYLVTVDEVLRGVDERPYRNTYAVVASSKPEALQMTRRSFKTIGVTVKVAHVERTTPMDEWNWNQYPMID